MTSTVNNLDQHITLCELARRLQVNRRTLTRWLTTDAAKGFTLQYVAIGNAKMIGLTDAQAFAARRLRLLSE